MDIIYKTLSIEEALKNKKELDTLLELLSGEKRVLSDEQLSLFVDNNSSIVIGAFFEDKLIGISSVYIMHKATRTLGFIEDVVVGQEFRNRGIATSLFTTLIERAKKEGVSQFNLTSHPSRVEANELYQKLGFKIKETNVYRLYCK